MKPALRDGAGAVESASELAGYGADCVSILAEVHGPDQSLLEARRSVHGPECGFQSVDDVAG